MKFVINSKENLVDYPIHVIHTYLDSFILYSNMNFVDDESQIVEVPKVMISMHEVLTAEGKEVNEEFLQLANPIEEIERIV